MPLSNKRRDLRDACLFLTPTLLFFSLFMILPLLMTLSLSFTKYNIIQPLKIIGLRNFFAFLSDKRLGQIYGNTLRLVAVLVPLHLVIGLALALGVHRKIGTMRKYLYRTVFYFPCIVTTASVAIAWRYMYHTEFGVINYFLGRLGIEPIPWLTSTAWSVPAIAIFSVWKFVGNSFLFYLVGLQSIPKSYYEAATIDGASSLKVFFRITLPLLTPTIFFVMVNLIIQATQIFDEPFLITHGGPGDSSRTVNLYIYELAYRSHRMGYAATVALSLFLLILVLTLLQFRLSNKWVVYETE